MQEKTPTTPIPQNLSFERGPIDRLALDIAAWAIHKGFWTDPAPGREAAVDGVDHDAIRSYIKTTKLMLVVTELAECVEHLRKPAPSSIEGFTNEEEEIADAIIRLLDYSGYYGLRIEAAIFAKMNINDKRPHQHGKNF